MDYVVVNPDPAGTVTSLGSLGYSLEAAVADLVDNSVAAEARSIDIATEWAGDGSWIAVVDEGSGMDAATITTAMRIAGKGPAAARTATDLGRFGLGLKTASFSQARQLVVDARTQGGSWVTRTWDLSVVEQAGEWRLGKDAPDDARALVRDLRRGRARGTTVLWRHLHRLTPVGGRVDDRELKQHFYRELGRVQAHLGMVFHRFLRAKKLTITMNGTPIKPWDPFLSLQAQTQRVPAETVRLAGHDVRIEGFVLPHRRYLSERAFEAAGGPKGWLDQQGFYVYRRDRLIVAGGWLGVSSLKKDERFILARLTVDVPAELDETWSIDVRKSSATPPPALRITLDRLAKTTREKAGKVLTHRGGAAAIAHASSFQYAWKVARRGGTVTCRINPEHPLVKRALRGDPEQVAPVKALLKLLEQTVPVGALRVMHEAETIDDPEPFGDSSPEETDVVAKGIYEALISQNETPAAARAQLRAMPPFDHLDGFWQK